MGYLKLSYEGDHLMNEMRYIVKLVRNQTPPAAKLQPLWGTRTTNVDNRKIRRLINSV